MFERQLELCGEQVRWVDLIRWGIAKQTLNAEKKAKFPTSSQSFFQDKHVLFPPLSEKITNSLVAKDVSNDWNWALVVFRYFKVMSIALMGFTLKYLNV